MPKSGMYRFSGIRHSLDDEIIGEVRSILNKLRKDITDHGYDLNSMQRFRYLKFKIKNNPDQNVLIPTVITNDFEYDFDEIEWSQNSKAFKFITGRFPYENNCYTINLGDFI